eukprot:scpid109183/ scgid3357/ 
MHSVSACKVLTSVTTPSVTWTMLPGHFHIPVLMLANWILLMSMQLTLCSNPVDGAAYNSLHGHPRLYTANARLPVSLDGDVTGNTIERSRQARSFSDKERGRESE